MNYGSYSGRICSDKAPVRKSFLWTACGFKRRSRGFHARAIEDQFNLSIPDEHWEKVKTVGDLFATLAELLQEQRG